MKEIIKRENPETREEIIIGYSSMMAPSSLCSTGKVYRMLRVLNPDIKEEGDLHFFEMKENRWLLNQELSFINLDGNQNLIDTYMNLPRNEEIEFETFIRIIFYSLHS